MEHCHTLDRNVIKLWAGLTIEASVRGMVVHQSVDKVLFVGATRSMSAHAINGWSDTMDRSKQYKKPNKCKLLPYVAMADIQMAA